MTTHRNHYVPVWYQKGFVSIVPPRFYYLDLNPEPAEQGRGARPAAMKSAPKQCFWSQDLYTTLFFGAPALAGWERPLSAAAKDRKGPIWLKNSFRGGGWRIPRPLSWPQKSFREVEYLPSGAATRDVSSHDSLT
jgi:hypothetical protein